MISRYKMQTIDLRIVKTVFICPDHNEIYNERRKHMENILAKHGFTNVIMYKSSTDYPKCLQYALYNILQQNLDSPVFIIEDDIVFHKNPKLVFDLPIDTDAFYFGVAGTSMDFEGRVTDRLLDTNDYDLYNDTLIRVKNMLCAHAILYLGRKYKETLSKLTLTSTMPCDVDMCKLQPKFNIYGLQFPMCWQSKKFNKTDWNEKLTRVRFNKRGCWTWDDAVEDDD
jgi:hypothetical protein